MKETLNNLLKVKSIVTIILTLVFSYLAIVGRISGEQFLVIFTTIIAFYFGSQSEKKNQAAVSTPAIPVVYEPEPDTKQPIGFVISEVDNESLNPDRG